MSGRGDFGMSGTPTEARRTGNFAEFRGGISGTPLTFPRLSYGNPEPPSKRGNALGRQWDVQPFAQQPREH